MARLRQAVFAARDLDATVERLRVEHGLGEPFRDPAVGYFGLRNAVFAIGDTFLEVVSPAGEDTAAGRLLERRGGDCGYMAMVQVEDIAAARERAAEASLREVFSVSFDDIVESHFHPADVGGAIVSVSEPRPPASWRWGGPDWEERAVAGEITGLTVAVADPDAVRERWRDLCGGLEGIGFTRADPERGIVAVDARIGDAAVKIEP